MKFLPTPITGVSIAEATPFTDHRGTFTRFFCENELADILEGRHIVQINYSRTETLGAVRGMHYQNSPYAEMKLIRCVKGRVWDVAIDLRAGSSTFLKWHAEELTPQNSRMLVIPEGCAHGFQVLESGSELLYLHTAFYNSDAEDGILHNDPQLGISWPLPVTDLSERDKQHLPLPIKFSGINI